MINTRSKFLVILIATFNRIESLKLVLNSIFKGTKCDHEIIVIDGGSTDGTIEYLQQLKNITAVFQGKLLGPARCYNKVWKEIDSKYTCWLSDDTELISGSLDIAINILEQASDIGMVGLKMKDSLGAQKNQPYLGNISEYGIINCNHGVLRTSLLKSIGFFNEAYKFYNIDPDLTASILCTGKKVVLTKQVAILHHREWATVDKSERLSTLTVTTNQQIYQHKFIFLKRATSVFHKIKSLFGYYICYILYFHTDLNVLRFGLNQRDYINLSQARFIKLSELWKFGQLNYYLIQKIPDSILNSDENPYKNLLTTK